MSNDKPEALQRLRELAQAAQTALDAWREMPTNLRNQKRSQAIDHMHYELEPHVVLSLLDTLAARDAELERERMRLAACGVVAMSNTPESAKLQRDIHPDYRSASCDDVARAVDREMAYREQLAARDAEIAALKAELDEDTGVIAVWRGRCERLEAEIAAMREALRYIEVQTHVPHIQAAASAALSAKEAK